MDFIVHDSPRGPLLRRISRSIRREMVSTMLAADWFRLVLSRRRFLSVVGIGRPPLDNVDRGLRSSLWLLGRPASRTDVDTPDSYLLEGLIVGLQDPDKISHAGSIPVFSHIRNLSIGRGLASLPEPHQEISDVSHGVLSINHHVKHQLSGEAPQDWRKPAGTTPPALSRNCRLAGPVPLLSL